jgi:hypothetical protein
MNLRIRRIGGALALVAAVMLSACGGGSNGGSPSTTTVTANTVTFDVASPDAATPAAATVTASVSPGTVYLTVLHSGTAITDVSYTLSGTTATITITPPSPGTLGAGVFYGAVSVTGFTCGNASCTSYTSGQSQVVDVTYNVPPIVRYVAPYVGTASTAETVIVRGQGFTKFAVQDVTFGGTSASSFTVVNDTQIQATHPALGAGSYAVQISAPTAPGTITSNANLVVTAAPGYGSQTLGYPNTVTAVNRLIYDAERGRLVLAVTDTAGGDLLTCPIGGGCTAHAITDLSDVALSTDGTTLFALSSTGGMTELNAASLVAGTVTAAPTFPTSGTFFKNLMPSNDGVVVVTTGYAGSANTPVYLYNHRSPAFTQYALDLDNATPGASADGALVWLQHGDASLSSAPAAYAYVSYADALVTTGVAQNQNTSIAPALDRSATRIVLGDSAGNVYVYNNGYGFLGYLPTTTIALVLSPDASRAYTYDGTQIHVFDLTAAVDVNTLMFPEIGTGTAVSSPGGTDVKMAISPDGGNLFLAGTSQIVVLPTP